MTGQGPAFLLRNGPHRFPGRALFPAVRSGRPECRGTAVFPSVAWRQSPSDREAATRAPLPRRPGAAVAGRRHAPRVGMTTTPVRGIAMQTGHSLTFRDGHGPVAHPREDWRRRRYRTGRSAGSSPVMKTEFGQPAANRTTTHPAASRHCEAVSPLRSRSLGSLLGFVYFSLNGNSPAQGCTGCSRIRCKVLPGKVGELPALTSATLAGYSVVLLSGSTSLNVLAAGMLPGSRAPLNSASTVTPSTAPVTPACRRSTSNVSCRRSSPPACPQGRGCRPSPAACT